MVTEDPLRTAEGKTMENEWPRDGGIEERSFFCRTHFLAGRLWLRREARMRFAPVRERSSRQRSAAWAEAQRTKDDLGALYIVATTVPYSRRRG